jgi:CDP-diglyceride synthetase
VDNQLDTFRKADSDVKMAAQALSTGLPIGLMCSNHVLSIQGVLVVAGVMVADILASVLDQFFGKNRTGTKPGADSIAGGQ